MPKQQYVIAVIGCDSETEITRPLTPTQLRLVQDIAEKITATSEYDCMPKMTVKPFDPEAKED